MRTARFCSFGVEVLHILMRQTPYPTPDSLPQYLPPKILYPQVAYPQIPYPQDTYPPGYVLTPGSQIPYPQIPHTLEWTWDQRSPTPPPFLNKLTDTCENITFPQLLLRAVISINHKCDDFNYFRPNKQSNKKGMDSHRCRLYSPCDLYLVYVTGWFRRGSSR